MINTFLFESDSPLLPGDYLLGSPTWPTPMGLINVRLTCKAGASVTRTVLQLEVDGELIDKQIHIFPPAPGARMNLVFPINFAIAAESELRVVCVSGPGADGDAVREVGLNLSAQEASSATPIIGDMFVRWIDGREQLRIFEYDSGTHLFTETVSGISAGRASIGNATTFVATIQSTVAARSNSSQQFKVNQVVCNGGLAIAESPRLEFYIGNSRVATLTKSGVLLVVDVEERASITAGDQCFEFYGNGILSAILGRSGSSGPFKLSTLEICEPA